MEGGADYQGYRRRHSDSPRLAQKKAEIRNVKELRNSPAFLLREKSMQNVEVLNSNNTDNSSQSPLVSLYEEYVQVGDLKCHKAVERHRVKREDDVISRHTTFFPKKLSEEEAKYAKSCAPLNSNPKSCYDMTKFPRGILSLVNVDTFCKSVGCDRRLGTDYDADELTSVFLNLGFIVQRYDNFTKKEMMMVLEKDAREDFSNLGCSVCAVSSCGNESEIFAIDKSVSIHTIANIFSNSNLADIPKIFILNAAKGSDYLDPADDEDNESSSPCVEETCIEETITLPPGDDILYACSTIAGFYSWKNNTRGCWFLQSLLNIFRAHAHDMELTRMLTGVNKRVRRKLERALHNKESGKRHQTSSFISKLTDDFYFCPPYGPLQLKKIPLKWVGLE